MTNIIYLDKKRAEKHYSVKGSEENVIFATNDFDEFVEHFRAEMANDPKVSPMELESFERLIKGETDRSERLDDLADMSFDINLDIGPTYSPKQLKIKRDRIKSLKKQSIRNYVIITFNIIAIAVLILVSPA